MSDSTLSGLPSLSMGGYLDVAHGSFGTGTAPGLHRAAGTGVNGTPRGKSPAPKHPSLVRVPPCMIKPPKKNPPSTTQGRAVRPKRTYAMLLTLMPWSARSNAAPFVRAMMAALLEP